MGRVAGGAASCFEVLESTAGLDFATGQPASKVGDDNVDVTNLVAALGVPLRQRKDAHLFKAPHDEFRLVQFGLVAVMAVHYRRREHTLRPQCSLDEFILGHS